MNQGVLQAVIAIAAVEGAAALGIYIGKQVFLGIRCVRRRRVCAPAITPDLAQSVQVAEHVQ